MERQVGMGVPQPTVSITSRLRGLLVGSLFTSGVLQALTAVYIKHYFDMSALSGLIPSVFSYKGLEVTVTQSKTRLRLGVLHKKVSASQVRCTFLLNPTIFPLS